MDEGDRWSGLMEAAQGGDRIAYNRLLVEIAPHVRALVGRYHRIPDLAEEVVQDVFLTIHRVRNTYDPRRPFRHWLISIARRRAIDALRQRRRWSLHEVTAESADRAYDTYPDPAMDGFAEAHAAADLLFDAIDRLPARQREAVRLLRLREYALADAAALAGRSVAALKVSVHRGLTSLREQLQAG